MSGLINSRVFIGFVHFAKPVLMLADALAARLKFRATPQDDPEVVVDTIPATEALSENIAIVATFQNGALDSNFENMLETLASKGVGLFVINNGKLSDSAAKRIKSFANLYHERMPGTGRDFASYKLGVRVLQCLIGRGVADPKRVIFANDSVLIEPVRYASFLDRVLSDPANWVGATESSERHYHVSSWFFAVSRRLWDSEAFQNYWATYETLHSRRHAIIKGEVGLSTALVAAGESPHVYYSAAHFLLTFKMLSAADLSNLAELVAWPFLNRVLSQFEVGNDGRQGAGVRLFGDLLQLQERTNQTAFWQLIALAKTDFPFIKKDIRFRRVFTVTQLRLAADLLRSANPYLSSLLERIVATRDPTTLGPIAAARYLSGLD